MKTITHEGKEYILKSDVDGLVRDRVSKISEARRIADSRIQELERQTESQSDKIKTVDSLHSQLKDLQEQLQGANQRYNRHSTIAEYGITNSNLRDAVEWSYDRAMSSRSKKDREAIGDWLKTIQEDPTKAPEVLKPHFQNKTADRPAQLPPQENGNSNPPNSNGQIVQTSNASTSADILSRAHDRNFYASNREQIKAAFYKSRGKNPFQG